MELKRRQLFVLWEEGGGGVIWYGLVAVKYVVSGWLVGWGKEERGRKRDKKRKGRNEKGRKGKRKGREGKRREGKKRGRIYI